MDTITICNLALNMLGIPQILNFDEANDNAKLCKRFFPVVRDRVLRDHPWSFAAASCKLSELADTAPFDPRFSFVCPLPGDLLRVNEIHPGAPYRIAGRNIFVTELPATLVYTRKVEDSSLFDETFAEALQYALAAEIGMANTRDPHLIALYRQEYERRLAIARSIDSQENHGAYALPPRRSHWIAARSAALPCLPAGKLNWVEGNAGKQ